jgi:hypothetical protein
MGVGLIEYRSLKIMLTTRLSLFAVRIMSTVELTLLVLLDVCHRSKHGRVYVSVPRRRLLGKELVVIRTGRKVLVDIFIMEYSRPTKHDAEMVVKTVRAPKGSTTTLEINKIACVGCIWRCLAVKAQD